MNETESAGTWRSRRWNVWIGRRTGGERRIRMIEVALTLSLIAAARGGVEDVVVERAIGGA